MALWTGGLALAAAAFLWAVPFAGSMTRALTNMGYSAYVLTWLLIITAFGRTVPLRLVATAFFAGTFPAMVVALGIGFPLGGILGTESRLFDSVLVPLLEESLKALPVLIILTLLARRGAWHPSITDGLLLGYAAGAGYALHEDAMYGRVVGSGFNGADLRFLFPTISDTRLLGVGRAFSVGHAEWTALVGAAIAAAFFFRNRARWSWAAPLVVLALVTFDHGSLNNLVGEGGAGASPQLRAIMLSGRLALYLLLAACAAAIATEAFVLRRMAERGPRYPSIPASLMLALLRTRTRAALRGVGLIREHGRVRRAALYAAWVGATPAEAPASAVAEQPTA